MIRRLLLVLGLAAAPLAAAATVAPPPIPPQPDWPPLPQSEPSERPPHGDALGQVWEEDEVSGWRGVWIRRGTSTVFDAYWWHPAGERVQAVLELSGRGREVTLHRQHPDGQSCRYEGRIAANWTDVAGRYTCSWEATPMPWRARIVRIADVTPAVLSPQ
ncbi:hypothetical protein [Phenylobacterium sp.]|jgi:hypothetical protein|uniref:hypothetical protein n=1 Tax=Phenylobacterium sp. TaxID=1871053 RepID=UPI002E34BB6D|nr:hypothetical protein [Phenylobacterium sp.]HEX2561212.1 hypothetical protein [Phenylobacterium sp.]